MSYQALQGKKSTAKTMPYMSQNPSPQCCGNSEDLANVAWAYAKLAVHNEDLFEALQGHRDRRP